MKGETVKGYRFIIHFYYLAVPAAFYSNMVFRSRRYQGMLVFCKSVTDRSFIKINCLKVILLQQN